MADKRRGRSAADDDVVKSLVNKNDKLSTEMEILKKRLNALEMQQQPSQIPNDNFISAVNLGGGGGDNGSDQAVTEAMNNGRGSLPTIETSEAAAASKKPPMRRIKFLDHHVAEQSLASNIITDSPQNSNINNTTLRPAAAATQQPDNDIGINDDDDSDAYSSSVSSEEALAFSGWARVFFQARHHQAATQITSGATSTTSQDTYLYLTIHSTENELRISNTDDRWKPPLIDPPIPLKYFYAVKVPGSHSGAALFLKNDTRRLRKYIFRFEFINRSVHQPPSRYIQFIRSGKAAKKSMRSYNKMKQKFNLNKMGEERKENIKADKKRAQDAFAAHLGTLDELLRESNDAAERFVECVNTRNEEEEELARSQRELSGSGAMSMGESGRSRRSKPPPPYWGSGFNRPSTNDNENGEMDDEGDGDSDSDISEEEDELYYDDDNDDETLFDKVQVSTEQTLETLFNHIVK